MALLMLIFNKISEIQSFLAPFRTQGKTIGFVPTMGALHEGHLSLIRKSKNDCDITICSIFVNPTQFNDKNDLQRYPRTPEKDIDLLKSVACDALFMPEIEEIYPKEEKASFNFGHLSAILEAEHRPGHFDGVAQVVKRFFEIVEPSKAYFGSKDYQQVMIIKALIKQMNSGIQIISCPILRETDGLAMSSRNTLLDAESRKNAASINVLMKKAGSIIQKDGIEQAKVFMKENVEKLNMRMDYYEVCNADTLEILSGFNSAIHSVSLIAVFAGKIRLIDNFPVNY